MKTQDHKCPGCAADLPFNPKLQKWQCEFCGKVYNLEELTEYEKEFEKEEKINADDEIDTYTCENCGATLITDENTASTFCVYCRSNTVIKGKLKGKFSPKYVIPFAKTKEEAIEAFKKCKKGKLFAPKSFNDLKNISEITGVYIPFWLNTASTNVVGSGVGKVITSWSSGEYRYTKVDTYSFKRGMKNRFKKVPTDGSKKFQDDIMNSIEPFDYNDLKPFNMSYLSGFFAEKYDFEGNDAVVIAKERMINTSKSEVEKTLYKYNTKTFNNLDINFEELEQEYVLLPVWMLNIKFKEKMYPFAMNGQTGKMIGNVPIDFKKFWGYFAICFIVTLILTIVFSIIYINI